MRSLLTLAVLALGSGEDAFRALQKSSLHEGIDNMVIRAREWLQAHKDPDQAGMDELKSTNPEAFAIVQALLTKKSLGLLNSKRPDAFAGYAGTRGATQESPPEAAPEVSVPVAAVAMEVPHSHKNWLNWKPHGDDDAMVSNVLGAVAELKTASAPAVVEAPAPQHHEAQMLTVKSDMKPAVQSAIATTSHSDWLNWHPHDDDIAKAVREAPAAPAAPLQHKAEMVAVKSATDNKQEHQVASASNRYMADIGKESSVAPEERKPKKLNALASFNWNDDSAKPEVAASTPKASMSQKNAYLSSLGVPAAATKMQDQTDAPNALTHWASVQWSDNDAAKTSSEPENAVSKARVAAVAETSHVDIHSWLNWHPHDDDIAEAVQEAPAAPQQHKAEMVAVKSATDSKQEHQVASANNINKYMVDLGRVTTAAPDEAKPKKLNALASFSWSDNAPKPKVADLVTKASMNQKNTYLGSLGVPAAATKSRGESETTNALTSFSWNDNSDNSDEKSQTSVAPQTPQIAAVTMNSYSNWMNWHPHDDEIAQAVHDAPADPPHHKAEMVAIKSTVKTAADSEQQIENYLITKKFLAAQSQDAAAAAAPKPASDSNGNPYLTDLGQGIAAAPEIPAPKKLNALASFSWSGAPKSNTYSAPVSAHNANPLSNPLGNWLSAKVV